MRSVEHFAPEPATAPAVRQFVRRTLVDWHIGDDLTWRVAQTATELATNVVLHARTFFSVELQLETNKLTISVTDQSPRRISIRTGTEEASTGRGLALVAQLSDDWGATTEDAGKTVWCSFDVPPSQAEQLEAGAI